MAINRKPDRRTLQTRAALRSAFVHLVLSRGYEAVTVEGIIARADVARSTFYLHYPSKLALLKQSLDVPSAGLAACLDPGDAASPLVLLLTHFREQRHVNRVFFADPIRSIWVRCLAGLIAGKLHTVCSKRGLPRPLLAAAVAEMQIALVIHWLKDAASVEPERIATALVASTRALLSS